MSARQHPTVCHRVSRHRQSNSSQSTAINGMQRHSGRTMRPNRTQRGKGAFGDEGGHQHAISMQLPCAQTQPDRAREGCLRCSCHTRVQGRGWTPSEATGSNQEAISMQSGDSMQSGWTPIKRRQGAIRRQLACNQEAACNQGGHLARRQGEGDRLEGGRS